MCGWEHLCEARFRNHLRMEETRAEGQRRTLPAWKCVVLIPAQDYVCLKTINTLINALLTCDSVCFSKQVGSVSSPRDFHRESSRMPSAVCALRWKESRVFMHKWNSYHIWQRPSWKKVIWKFLNKLQSLTSPCCSWIIQYYRSLLVLEVCWTNGDADAKRCLAFCLSFSRFLFFNFNFSNIFWRMQKWALFK